MEARKPLSLSPLPRNMPTPTTTTTKAATASTTTHEWKFGIGLLTCRFPALDLVDLDCDRVLIDTAQLHLGIREDWCGDGACTREGGERERQRGGEPGGAGGSRTDTA